MPYKIDESKEQIRATFCATKRLHKRAYIIVMAIRNITKELNVPSSLFKVILPRYLQPIFLLSPHPPTPTRQSCFIPAQNSHTSPTSNPRRLLKTLFLHYIRIKSLSNKSVQLTQGSTLPTQTFFYHHFIVFIRYNILQFYCSIFIYSTVTSRKCEINVIVTVVFVKK